MKVRIHRGAKQIGGTCIEVEAQGKRIVLDIGQPLDCPDAKLAEMPDVKGFKTADPSLLGVVLSHPHLDHYGLASRLPPTTMFLMGEAAERILTAAAVFIPSAKPLANVTHLEDGKPLRFGPFTITPFLMDHSAYDSYAVLVEADGRRLFYTGDLRGHGRKGKLFDKLVTHPPQNVDVLLMEGTTLKRLGTEDGFPTEGDIENKLVDIFKVTKGMPLVWCSGQNIDRLVTVFRAAKRSGRQLIVDMYAAHVLDATQKASIPQAKWKELRVFLPQGEKRRIKDQEAYNVSDQYRPYRIFPEHLAEVTARSVMLFRPSMKRDVESAGCLDGACLVYSMWDGYLKKEERFLTWLKERGIPLHQCHTSGHASLPDLKRLRKAFQTAVVVPIHTEQPSLYEKNFGNVHVYEDGEWWEVEQQTKTTRTAMTTELDNAKLAQKLRDARSDIPNKIKLPGSIKFTIDGAMVRMHLKETCVQANMQDNSSSFEGWALALKRWLPEFTNIEMNWDFCSDAHDPHYQRFLFRAKQFSSLFPWFSISPAIKNELNKLRTAEPQEHYITAPKKIRPRGIEDADTLPGVLLNEHKLECLIKEQAKPLSDLFGITQMDRQYPVGVFDGAVKKGKEIFPRGHSAIDLWGTGKTNELFIFELKAAKNIPIGILSELFFYSFIVEGIQQGHFKLQKPNGLITSTKKVRAYILAPHWHPLIDNKLLQMANDAFKANGRPIRFGAVRIVPKDPRLYMLEMQACD